MNDDFMYWPSIAMIHNGDSSRPIPHVPVPKDYLELVPRFYDHKGDEIIETYKDRLAGFFGGVLMTGKPDIRLRWHDTEGLTNVSLGIHGGFDLSEDRKAFQEHNLGGLNSFMAGAIAQEYVLELLKNRE